MSKTRAVAYIRVSTEKDAQLNSYDFQEHSSVSTPTKGSAGTACKNGHSSSS